MRHEYYQYNKEELLRDPKIALSCLPDNEAVFRQMADQMIDEIEKNNRAERKTVFICPVGPVGQYPYFVEMVNERGLSLKNVWFINMDEYLDDQKQWVPMDHPLSFRGFMERTVYSQIYEELLMPKRQRVFPDPNDVGYIPRLIEELGGVDIAFGGIGINGHVAFNEADPSLTNEAFLNQKTRVLAITPETRTANAIGDFNGALEDMPHYCISIGMYEISHARKIRLGCFRNWHRAVVRRAAYGEQTSAFPVTLLQDHPDLTLTFTDFVANLE
ncbi:glucosamine-6-phosphate isomerase [Brotaphodocola sp.]|uniref:glucosamine-6-phosphate isomerase n=1 Tax=Brotaphodocola sp. TaxID=3073577 RepID=UPI003D7C81FC